MHGRARLSGLPLEPMNHEPANLTGRVRAREVEFRKLRQRLGRHALSTYGVA